MHKNWYFVEQCKSTTELYISFDSELEPLEGRYCLCIEWKKSSLLNAYGQNKAVNRLKKKISLQTQVPSVFVPQIAFFKYNFQVFLPSLFPS